MRKLRIIGDTSSNPICRDYGKLFAESLGLELEDYRTTKLNSEDIFIFDMMIPTADLIKAVGNSVSYKNVFYRFVDDDPTNYNQYSLELRSLFLYSSMLGARIISPYTWKYFGRYIARVIPYHYRESDERPFGKDRIPYAILSGQKDASYPMRYDLYERAHECEYIKIKQHPGYQKGEKIDDYLSDLSKYKLMIVTTGDDYELLKYVECAEAGCCPIGEFPSSLLSIMPYKLRFLHCYTPTKVIQRIPSIMKDWLSYARLYREFMKKARNFLNIRDQYFDL